MDGHPDLGSARPAAGFKEVRHRVIDLDSPGMREEIKAALARINASEEEANLLADIEQITAEVWSSMP